MKITEEREKLESMLNNSPEDINKNVPTQDQVPELSIPPTMDVDFDDLKTVANDEARKMVINSMRFILDKDMLKDEYLRDKLEVDIMSLAGMIYQLRCNEAMQRALMEEVKRGQVHPRAFEVFGGLSKTIGELNKQLLQTVEAIKETHKSAKNEIKEKRTESSIGSGSNRNQGMLTTNDGGVVALGSKELINNIKKAGNVEDVTEE